MIGPGIDHIGLNVKDIDESINFYSEFFGFDLLQRWDEPKQAFLELDGIIIGIMEAPGFDYDAFTMAHIAFPCDRMVFPSIVEKIREHNLIIVSGPKPQRGGETILFRDPSGNILEICYPSIQEWKKSED